MSAGEKRDKTFKGFRKLSDDVFPFACYYDKKTVITKNGELMQTIAIISHDNNANVNGIFGDNIRNAIKVALGDNYKDYAFWIHSIKITDEFIANIKQNQNGNPLCKIIKKEWNNYKKTFDNYMVVAFITFVHIAMSLTMNPANFMTFVNKSLLYRIHGMWVKKHAHSLTLAADKVMKQLSQYSIRRLQIIKKGNEYDSEHLEFWDRIINFSNSEYGVPIADLSSIINRSTYKIDISTLVVKNDQVKKYCAFFSLKDNNNISPALVSDIISKLKNVILVESFHFENTSMVKQTYAKQIMQLKKHAIDNSIIAISGLSELVDIDKTTEIFCRHYGGLILICDSIEDLETEIKAMSAVSMQNGIVFGCEDIGVERAFYGIIPGNFSCMKHYNIVPFKDVFALVNSHVMDNDNIESYLDKQVVCILPTMKKYPYAFGILAEKPDILISGPKHSEIKYIFSKTLISLLSANLDKICIIDTKSSVKTFLDMSEGVYYEVDTIKNDFSTSFAPFRLGKISDIDGKEIITNMISMMIMAFDGKIKNKDIDNISSAIDTAKNIQDISDKTAEGIMIKLKNWQKDQSLGFLFDTDNDVIEKSFLADNKAIIGFNLNENILKNRFIRCLITYYIVLKFISIVDNTKRNMMVINDPIFLMDHYAFKLEWDLINKMAREKNVSFMFINNDANESLSGEKTKISIKDLLKNCDTQFHFGGTSATEEYAESYGLNNGEVYAINGINSSLSTAILKQNGIILPIHAETSELGDIIRDICQDGPMIRSKIAKITEKTNDITAILKELTDSNYIKQEDTLEQDQDTIDAQSKVADVGMQILNSA